MATMGGKQQIITFKAEEALVEAMEDIPNRSEFIRSAILAALDGVCPPVPRHRGAQSSSTTSLAGVQPHPLRRALHRVRRGQACLRRRPRLIGDHVAASPTRMALGAHHSDPGPRHFRCTGGLRQHSTTGISRRVARRESRAGGRSASSRGVARHLRTDPKTDGRPR